MDKKSPIIPDLFLILCFALVIMFLRSDVIYAAPDFRVYGNLAMSILHGDGYVEKANNILYPNRPIYPLILALIFKLVDSSYNAAHFISKISYVGIILTFYIVGKKVIGNYYGWLLVSIVLFSNALFSWTLRLHLDIFFAFLQLLCISILYWGLTRDKYKYKVMALSGVIFGITYLTKESILIFLPLPILFFLAYKWRLLLSQARYIAVFFASFALTVIPWFVFALFTGRLYQATFVGAASAYANDTTGALGGNTSLYTTVVKALTLLFQSVPDFYNHVLRENFIIAPLFVIVVLIELFYWFSRQKEVWPIYLLCIALLSFPLMIVSSARSGIRAMQFFPIIWSLIFLSGYRLSIMYKFFVSYNNQKVYYKIIGVFLLSLIPLSEIVFTPILTTYRQSNRLIQIFGLDTPINTISNPIYQTCSLESYIHHNIADYQGILYGGHPILSFSLGKRNDVWGLSSVFRDSLIGQSTFSDSSKLLAINVGLGNPRAKQDPSRIYLNYIERDNLIDFLKSQDVEYILLNKSDDLNNSFWSLGASLLADPSFSLVSSNSICGFLLYQYHSDTVQENYSSKVIIPDNDIRALLNSSSQSKTLNVFLDGHRYYSNDLKRFELLDAMKGIPSFYETTLSSQVLFTDMGNDSHPTILMDWLLQQVGQEKLKEIFEFKVDRYHSVADNLLLAYIYFHHDPEVIQIDQVMNLIQDGFLLARANDNMDSFQNLFFSLFNDATVDFSRYRKILSIFDTYYLQINSETFNSQDYIFLVELYLAENEVDKAQALLEEGVLTSSEDTNLVYTSISLFDRYNQREALKTIIDNLVSKLVTHNSSSNVDELLATYLYKSGNKHKGFQILYQALVKNLENPKLTFSELRSSFNLLATSTSSSEKIQIINLLDRYNKTQGPNSSSIFYVSLRGKMIMSLVP